MLSVFVAASSLVSAGSFSQSTALLAHYPLSTNGADRLGKCPPFVVIDTLSVGSPSGAKGSTQATSFPFMNGVLYVDGIYEPNGRRIDYLGTAPLRALNYRSWTLSLDFYPVPIKRAQTQLSAIERGLDSFSQGRYSRWMGILPNDTANVLTGGYSYRWFIVQRDDNFLRLALNNGSWSYQFHRVSVAPWSWHNLICSVDLTEKKILTFFDGKQLETINLPPNFRLEVVGSPDGLTDQEFVFANHGNGSVFHGYAANLRVFARSLTPTEMATLYDQLRPERPTFQPHRSLRRWVVGGVLVVIGMMLFFRRSYGRLKCPPEPSRVGDHLPSAQ